MSNPFESGNAPTQWFTIWKEMQDTLPHDAMTKVDVDQPVESGAMMMRKHMLYPVRTKFTMKRSYTDFFWLSDVLNTKYIGMWLPAVPAKYPPASVKTGKAVYIKNRSVQLTLWLNSILTNPFLTQDSAVIAFLTVLDDKEWKQAKEDAKVVTLFTETSQGAEAWRGIVRNLDSNPEAPALIERTRARLADLLEAAGATRDNILRVCETSAQLYCDLNEEKDGDDVWRDKEKDVETDAMLPSPVDCGTKGVGVSISAISTNVANLLNTTTALNRIHNNFLLPTIMHQISMLEGAVAMIQAWDLSRMNIEKCQKDIEKLMGTKDEMIDTKEGRRSSIFGRVNNMRTTTDKMDKEITAKEEEVQEMRRMYDLRERAIFFSEVERFFVERAQRLASLASQTLAANHGIASQISETSKRVTNQCAVECGAFEGKMAAIFDDGPLKVQAVFENTEE